MPNLNDLKKEVNETEEKFDPMTGDIVPVQLVEEKQHDKKPIAASVWDEIVSAGKTVPENQVLMGLGGPEGVGKIGIELDSITL